VQAARKAAEEQLVTAQAEANEERRAKHELEAKAAEMTGASTLSVRGSVPSV
jgi:hypothetical protein